MNFFESFAYYRDQNEQHWAELNGVYDERVTVAEVEGMSVTYISCELDNYQIKQISTELERNTPTYTSLYLFHAPRPGLPLEARREMLEYFIRFTVKYYSGPNRSYIPVENFLKCTDVIVTDSFFRMR